MKLRLMGLRCTNLVSTAKKGGIDFFGTGEASTVISRTEPEGGKNTSKEGEGNGMDEWEVWPEGEFEEAARLEREDEMNELEQLSQELQQQEEQHPLAHQDPEAQAISSPIRSKRKALDSLNDSANSTSTTEKKSLALPQQNPRPWACPICSRSQPAGNDKAFNAHIDYCLSRQTIKEAVRASSPPPPASSSIPTAALVAISTASSTSISKSKSSPPTGVESKGPRGRGRPKKRKVGGEEGGGAGREGKREGGEKEGMMKQMLLFGR